MNNEIREPDELDLLLDEQLHDVDFRHAFEDAQLRATLISQLVNQRKAVRLTQAEVAHRMGTTQSAVSDFECSGGDVFMSTLQRYARAVGSYVRPMVVVSESAPSRTFKTSWSSQFVRDDGRQSTHGWKRVVPDNNAEVVPFVARVGT